MYELVYMCIHRLDQQDTRIIYTCCFVAAASPVDPVDRAQHIYTKTSVPIYRATNNTWCMLLYMYCMVLQILVVLRETNALTDVF